ncbi:MAG: hypothetical protein FWD57_10740 [Polyangiaceae bacterium]|nr:hypothetical protein [Polyangiaceae bacterium]
MSAYDVNQSFGVEDIRRIRDEDARRYQNMTYQEITKDISERAEVIQAIKERMRKERNSQQGA